MRPLDVVVYGANGFTGRLVARYLAARGGHQARIGLAGRSASKLVEVRAEAAAAAKLPSWEPELIVAESTDAEALGRLASGCRVVISTAGPYTECGTPLVDACVRHATDYVDINGEVPWMRTVAREYDSAAAVTGTRLVLSCGFSAPSDLGALFAVHTLRSRYGVDARSVRAFVQFNGRLSGGTMATGLMLDRALATAQQLRKDPFALGGAPQGGQLREEDADPTDAEFEPTLGIWAAPFWMSEISSRVVRRSHELFRQAEASSCTAAGGYGEHFGYRELGFARDEAVARAVAGETPSVQQRERLIARGKLPAPGQGPSAETRARSYFRTFVLAQGSGGEKVFVSTSGGDPGYEETAKIVSEAALLLALRRDELPRCQRPAGSSGGVLTPAFALGFPFISELRTRGVGFNAHEEPEAGLSELVQSLAAQLPPRDRCIALACDAAV